MAKFKILKKKVDTSKWIIHTSDLGLKNWSWGGICKKTGLNKGFLDAYNAFEFIVDQAVKWKVGYFIIAGDINEERNPEALLIEKFCVQIQKLVSAGIKTIIVAGNHDLDGSIGSSTSISYLKALKLENVYISDLSDDTFDFEDVTFHCLPYFTKHQLGFDSIKDLQSYVNNWLSTKPQGFDGTKKNIFISHYAVDTSFHGNEIDEVRLPFDLMVDFDYVALGHIHQWEDYSSYGVNGGFCGSPYIKNFGENVDKYFNLVKLDKVDEEGAVLYNSIEIPSRSFMDIELDATESDLSEVLATLKDNFDGKLEDTMVKVRLRTHQRFNPKPIYDFLREQKVFHYLPIHWNIVQADRKLRVSIDDTLSDLDVVKNYVNSCNIENNWLPKIIDIHKEIEDEIKKD